MKIAVIGKRRQAAADIPRIVRLFDLLDEMKIFTAVQRPFFDAMTAALGHPLDADDVFEGADFTADIVISIGGDGTFLRAARWVREKQIPIVGFNTGHLGFLAEQNLDDAPTLLADLVKGHYDVEPRSLLHILPQGYGAEAVTDEWPYALNEVAILREDTASMISVDTRLDSMPVADYQGDGLIISTPTGSTAYNLSVGGPIIQPTAPCWALSPIAPHALTMRPLVVSDSHTIEVSVTSRADHYRIAIDGRTYVVPVSVKLRVRRAPFVVNVIHSRGHNFVHTLSSKLLWGVSHR